MIESIFLKELILIKQVRQKSVIFVTIGILKILVLSMTLTLLATSVIDTYLCNRCHDLMQKATSFNNVAIAYVKGNAYRIHFSHMSKDDAINIMNGSNLVDKISVL